MHAQANNQNMDKHDICVLIGNHNQAGGGNGGNCCNIKIISPATENQPMSYMKRGEQSVLTVIVDVSDPVMNSSI